MAILLGYRGEQHVPRALESGQLSGHCGLRIWLNGERPVAIDPNQTCRLHAAAPTTGFSVVNLLELVLAHYPRSCLGNGAVMNRTVAAAFALAIVLAHASFSPPALSRCSASRAGEATSNAGGGHGTGKTAK